MSQPALLRIRSPWTDRGGQIEGRPELAKSCACFCQGAGLLSKHPHTIAVRCAHIHAQTTTRNFYFLQSQSGVRRHSCQMSPSDSASYTGRRRSCTLCSAGVLIVNPDAVPLGLDTDLSLESQFVSLLHVSEEIIKAAPPRSSP